MTDIGTKTNKKEGNNSNNEGGLFKEIKSSISDLFSSGKKKLSTAQKNLDSYIDSKKSELFDDRGYFDKDKAKMLLEEGVDVAKTYGQRFINTLKKGIAAGAEELHKYRFPSQDDLNSKYAGIGSRNNDKFLFIKDYDECIEFSSRVEQNLTGVNAPNTRLIIQDIKDSVSSNPQELISFYKRVAREENTLDETMKLKIKDVERYLMNK